MGQQWAGQVGITSSHGALAPGPSSTPEQELTCQVWDWRGRLDAGSLLILLRGPPASSLLLPGYLLTETLGQLRSVVQEAVGCGS